MPSPDRRATGRRRAWGRGPINLKLESLEGRALLAAGAGNLPDLVNSALAVSSNVSDWGQSVQVNGRVTNQGSAATTAPLQVSLYASSVRGVNKYSVPIGQVTIPAGVAPGQSVPYQTPVWLPTSPIPNVSGNGGTASTGGDGVTKYVKHPAVAAATGRAGTKSRQLIISLMPS